MKASDKFKEDLEAAVKGRKLFYRMQSTGGSYIGAGWYFWDETWTHITGPYPSHQECRKACEDYARNL